MNTASYSAQVARDVVSIANARGWTISVDHEVFRATKSFTPGDLDAYTQADSEWYSFVSLINRTRPGSIWGSTSDGVGGYVAHKNGLYEINMSGGSKRILSAIRKMI
jgi:hypothetical protein